MSPNKKIVLIDALALAYKAYFAFIGRPLRTKDGFPTSAVFGFFTQFLKILEDLRPDYAAVAFDSKEATFRHDAYSEYKANRAQMPDDMIPQLAKIRELVEVFNIPAVTMPGFEADDIIGTLAKQAEAEGFDVFMVTPDKDYMQLITPNIKLVKPGKSNEELRIYDPAKMEEEYGFPPSQMIDYLALIGDSSDNVPGVKGVGEKSAVPLLLKYSTVENIYEKLEEITPAGVQKKLSAAKEMAFLSKWLVTIKTDVPVTFDAEALHLHNPDFARLKTLCDELEFKAPYIRAVEFFRAKGETASPETMQQTAGAFNKEKVTYHTVTSLDDAVALARKLSKLNEFVFDTETNSLDPFTVKIAGASFCMKEGEAYFVALNPFDDSVDIFHPDVSDRLPVKEFVKVFAPVFENANIRKICQNGKFDISILRSIAIGVKGFAFDTMVAAYLLDADQKVGMDDLSEKYLQYTPIPLTALLGPKKDPSKIFEVPLQQLSDYAAEDADITFRLYTIFQNGIATDGLQQVANEVDFPLIPVLEQMEHEGIKLDTAMLRSLSGEMEKELEEISQSIHSLAGEKFNINSTQQLQKILFEKLQLKSAKKTKTGFSTNAQTLETLRGEHDIIDELLNYRQISKLKSTYTDALAEIINPATGRVHTTFNQTIAATGRLSSIDPNLQNIPIRTERGKEIRKAFIPSDENHIILSADYSQIELRIMASMSGDERMIEAFQNNEDIHRSTAALVFRVPKSEVTSDMRRKAKEVNFGILYGIGAFGLKTRLKISQAHAKEIIETYFATFRSIKSFIDECTASAREKGYAQTLLGRRRYLRNINSSNFVVKQFEERVAVNMPIQGTAADMIKLAMISIHHFLAKEKLRSKMVLQVHDELVFDVHKAELDFVRPEIQKRMEEALPLSVPLLVEIGTGENWLDAH